VHPRLADEDEDRPAEDLEEEFGLRAEVMVDAPLGGPERVGDVVHGGRLIAAPHETFRGGGEHLLAPVR